MAKAGNGKTIQTAYRRQRKAEIAKKRRTASVQKVIQNPIMRAHGNEEQREEREIIRNAAAQKNKKTPIMVAQKKAAKAAADISKQVLHTSFQKELERSWNNVSKQAISYMTQADTLMAQAEEMSRQAKKMSKARRTKAMNQANDLRAEARRLIKKAQKIRAAFQRQAAKNDAQIVAEAAARRKIPSGIITYNPKAGINWIHVEGGVINKFPFPVSPPEVKVETTMLFAKHTIIGLGEIQIPNGQEQEKISWEGRLPAYWQPLGFMVQEESFIPPNEIINNIESFRVNKTPVKLTIDGMLSSNVYVSSFNYKKGPMGDYTYDIEWLSSRLPSITSQKSRSRNHRAAKQTPNPYPGKKGQTLYQLAKIVYKDGSKWKTLYKKNKKALNKAGNFGRKKTCKLKKNAKLRW